MDFTARLWGWIEFYHYSPSGTFVVLGLPINDLLGAMIAPLNNTFLEEIAHFLKTNEKGQKPVNKPLRKFKNKRSLWEKS